MLSIPQVVGGLEEHFVIRRVRACAVFVFRNSRCCRLVLSILKARPAFLTDTAFIRNLPSVRCGSLALLAS